MKVSNLTKLSVVLRSDLKPDFFVLQQQQNLGRRFGTSKMHLSPPVA